MYLPRSAGGNRSATVTKDQRHDHPAANALDRPERNERVHRWRDGTQHGPDVEYRDPADEQPFATVNIRDRARDEHDGRRGDYVGRRYPGEPVESVKIGHDPRDCGRDDRLIERGEEQRKRDADQGQAHLPRR